jgi:hypothetical protein
MMCKRGTGAERRSVDRVAPWWAKEEEMAAGGGGVPTDGHMVGEGRWATNIDPTVSGWHGSARCRRREQGTGSG